MDKEIAKILLKVNAVTLRVKPPYKWASGILSPIYTDNRALMSFPAERKRIIDYYIKTIKKNNLKADVIAGIASSGIPWAAWIADKLDLPMVYIRKKKKDHGKQNLIEGRLKKGQKVIIIEDLVSTGGSSVNGIHAIKAAGCKVIANVAIFSYELNKAEDNFKKERVNLINLTNISTLISVAVEQHYISESEKQQILEWRKNPEKWH